MLEMGEEKRAIALADQMAKSSDEMLTYYKTHHIRYSTNEYTCLRILDVLYAGMRSAGKNELAVKYEEMLKKHLKDSQYAN